MVVTEKIKVKASGKLYLPDSVSRNDIEDMLALISDKITITNVTKKGKRWAVKFKIVTTETLPLHVLNDILDKIESYHISINWHIDDVQPA